MKSKVVSNPVREPINRQAAFIMRKAKWIEQPIPDSPENKAELTQLREEVKQLKAKNIAQAQHLTSLRKRCDKYEADLKSAQRRMEDAAKQLSEKASNATGEEKEKLEKASKRAATMALLTGIKPGIIITNE